MRRFLTLSGAAIAVLSMAACDRAQAPIAPKQVAGDQERLVVRETLAPDVKSVDAVAATTDLGEARARIGGSITRLLVTESDRVRKGQLLASVSDPRIDLQTRAFDAEAAAARAEAGRAAANLTRARTLYEKGFFAKASLDEAEAADEAAKATLAAALAQRAASAELSAQGAILSPGDGRVISARIPAGSVVTAGQSVVTVATGAPVLRLEIPEREAGALRVGGQVPILGGGGSPAANVGVIRKIYPAVSGGRVVADIEAPGLSAPTIGAKVTVAVTLGQRRAILIPPRFIVTRFGLDYVRLVGPGETISEIPVQIASRAPDEAAEVISGLKPGDVIAAPPLARGGGRTGAGR
jgi:RND family efflux transporter MFP subunit